MRLKKDRRAITAVVDAMIFIVLMGLAVTVITLTDTPPERAGQEPGEIANAVFLGSATPEEFGLDSDSGRPYAIADLTAASLATGDGAAADYLGRLLTAACGRPDAFLLTFSDGERSGSAGTGAGRPAASFECDYLLEYGGTLHIVLHLC